MNHRQAGRSSALPLLLAGAAVALAGYTFWERMRWRPHMASEPRTVAARGQLADFEQTAIDVFERVSPSVVHISNRTIRVRTWGYIGEIPGGTGTGFVWDENGYIVTNWHVVEQAIRRQETVLVRFANQHEYDAQVVDARPEQDIAVLKLLRVPAKLQPIPAIGSSSDLRVGQSVFAIGNPFGYDQSLSTGVVSALNRTIRSDRGTEVHSAIQVDAAINPGNSGGPLLDSAGRLIGMNTAIFSPSGASAGIGFAIPVDTINEVVPGLIDPSKTPPRLGVVSVEIPREDMVMVLRTLAGFGAADAGIIGAEAAPEGTLGDVIVSVDGKPVHQVSDISAAIADRKPGAKVPVVVLRGLPAREERLQVMVELR
jgi:2-alkenal reductase